MARLSDSFSGLSDSVVGAARNIRDSFGVGRDQLRNVVDGIRSPAAATVIPAREESEILSRIRWTSGKAVEGVGTIASAPFKGVHAVGKPIAAGSANAAFWIVKQPVAWAVNVGSWGVKHVGNFYVKAPWLAWPLTALAVVAGVGHVVEKDAARRTQDELMTKAAAIQAQAGNYQVNADDSALLMSRLREGGLNAGGGYADRVRAAKEADATPVMADKPTANLAAL
jgi:hypothetical protein